MTNSDRTVRPNSLVDGEWFGLEDDKVRGLSGVEVLEDETPLGECAPILLTLVFGEEGHLGGASLYLSAIQEKLATEPPKPVWPVGVLLRPLFICLARSANSIMSQLCLSNFCW